MPHALPPLVLAYHGVADMRLRDDPYSLFVSPARLRRHIDRVRRWGYTFATFSELAEAVGRGGDGGAGLAALTFDDGFVDNLTVLAALLEDEGVPATVFVVSGLLGAAHPDAPSTRTMTADEVRSLHGRGVEIGSHAATHTDLTSLSRAEAEANLRRSREELGALVGTPPTALAYPFGLANDETRAAAAAAGFAFACQTGDRGRWDDPLLLPRSAMNNTSTLVGLRLKRDGVYEPLMRRLPFRLARSAKRRALVLTR